MTIANPEVNYVDERLKLRSIYVNTPPVVRLKVIRQRLAQQEIGPTRLVTVVSAVEALARSLVVHAKATSSSDVEQTYSSYRDRAPEVLVEDVLKAFHHKAARDYFCEDTWMLFREAVNFRNQVVHECTYLGQDKYPSLIAATQEILENLITIGGLGTSG